MKGQLNKLFIFFTMLCCIPPGGASELMPSLYLYWYTYMAMLCSSIIIPVTILRAIQRKVSMPFVILIIFIAYGLFVTVVMGGEYVSYVRSWFYPLTIICLFQNNKHNLPYLLRCMMLILELLVVINLYYMIKYPEGAFATEKYSENWFLGYKSSFQYVFFPLLLIGFIFYHYKKELLNLIFILFVIHVETIMSWNAMFLVVLLLLDILVIFDAIRFKHLFNIRVYVLSVIAVNIGFIFFFYQLINEPSISYLFGDILGKDDSLITRITMWVMALKYILLNPIIGVGYLVSDDIASLSGITQPHVHNQWLSIVLSYGFVGLAIFLLFVISVLVRIKEHYNLYISRLIAVFLWGLFLSVTVEIFTTSQAMCIWPIFLMGYYVVSFDRQMERCKLRKNK